MSQGAADQEFVGDVNECFTSFEEGGSKYFLFYIPWLFPDIKNDARVEQSNAHALTGTYSAYFYETPSARSYLETASLPIPPRTSAITVGGWIFVESSQVQVRHLVHFDGNQYLDGAWSFADADCGGWVYRSLTVAVPAGALGVKATIWLDYQPRLANNCFWLDDYMVDFVPELPPGARNVVVADQRSQITAYDIASGSRTWAFRAEGGPLAVPPAAADGRLLFATSNFRGAKVGAIDARSGAKIWSQPLPGGSFAPARVWGTTVLVMCGDGYLRTYTTADGAPGWTLNVLELMGDYCRTTGTVLDGSRLYVTSQRGAYAVDLNARTVLWRAHTGDAFPVQPAFADGMLCVGTSDGRLVALDCATGTDRWSFATLGPVYCEPQVTGGVVMFGSDDGHLYGTNAQTGTGLWRLSFPGTQVRSFTFDSGHLYVAPVAPQPKVSCWALRVIWGLWSWTSRWQASLGCSPQADPILFGSWLFVSCEDGTLVALDAATGARQWTGPSSPGGALARPTFAIEPDQLEVTRRFDQVCWLCAHNAYANLREGWSYAQQGPAIIDQLEDGVRALMLDTWVCPVGTEQVVYAHEGCTLSKLAMWPWSRYTRLQDSLAQIAAWLRANPSEIVTVIFEQRADVGLFQQALDASGARPLMFYADRTNKGSNGSDWNVGLQGWPSLKWMIDANLRLVVFSDMGVDNDGLPRIWNYAVENWWGNRGRDGTFDARLESAPLQNPTPSLFVMNYNWDFSLNVPFDADLSWTVYDIRNDGDKIIGFIEACRRLRQGRLPNFLAVDWYNNGMGGGPARAVAFANQRWAERSQAAAG